MLKVGIGPSSSHTLGPWRAAERFVQELKSKQVLEQVEGLTVALYGSLALTGKGHGTDIAIILGLGGNDPAHMPVDQVQTIPFNVALRKRLRLGGGKEIKFDPDVDLQFHFSEALPFHANGLRFYALSGSGNLLDEATYYSIGGGFVVREGEEPLTTNGITIPFLCSQGRDVLRYCVEHNLSIAQLVRQNERSWRTDAEIDQGLLEIWRVMKESIYRGCHTQGVLPGGLHVNRRAPIIAQKILCDLESTHADQWVSQVKNCPVNFSQTLKLVGSFAMAVNEENANFGRIVTAPTNGAAGVIPAVLMYYYCFSGLEVGPKEIIDFLLVAGELGSLFKKGSTISAAMGGCQAEIGVSSAMAAAALTEGLGGSPDQALMAAEIAMEHHLGLTCDPVGGLVQVPCIERNSMGAVKALTAANIALDSDPSKARVTLDDVVKTMWQTSQDMNTKYKETSLGGLAANISIGIAEC